MKRKIEILAPAGSYEGMTAAIAGGCDAVYIGGKSFGARAFADNLEEDVMKSAIDYVHLHEKKIYMTVNTLLKNEEIENRLYEYLLPYYEQGLDAVIVQDIGVMSFVHKYFPDMHIHASTQMTLTSEKGTKWLKELGVNRFVTSRELSIQEIKKIRKETDLEIESFVHGALCYCYSGQCFMSSFLGGRSGNRGTCAQPCRKVYELYDNGQKVSNETERYLLSPKDMCTIEMIPELVDAGIDSFKIEGRMKRPEYAAYTAFLYRKYTDLYLELGREEYTAYLKKNKNEWNQNRKELMDLYNRGGFTKGYYMQYNGKDMMSLERPNHSGVCVGTVLNTKNGKVQYQLQEVLRAQDVLEFRSKKGECLYEYTVKEDTDIQMVEAKIGHNTVIPKGTKVYRTRSNQLLDKIQKQILEKEKKYPIQGYFTASENEKMSFTVVWKEHAATVEYGKAEKAQNQPISKEKIEKQLKKMNNTIFYLEYLSIELNGDLFIPVGKLNEIRRMAIEALEQQVLSSFRRNAGENRIEEKNVEEKNVEEKNIEEKNIKEENVEENKIQSVNGVETIEIEDGNALKIQNTENKKSINTTISTELVVSVCTYQQFQVVKNIENIHTIYVSMALEKDEIILQMLDELKAVGKKAYLILPAILRRKQYELFENAVWKEKEDVLSKILCHANVLGYVIKNYEEAVLFHKVVNEKFSEKELILDYNMYTWNHSAEQFFETKGIKRTTMSIELEYELWKESDCRNKDIIVYGHLPLMTSAQCVVRNTKGCRKVPEVCKLTDEKKRNFYVNNCCKYCYNLIYTEKPISLHGQLMEIQQLNPYRLRMDFTIEQPEVVERRIMEMSDFLTGKRKDAKHISYEYTLGHYKKGVL